MKKVSILSLGCSKNLVDSERLCRRFADAGFDARFVEEPQADGSILVVNTCGFIGDAKEESVMTLLEALKIKEEGGLDAVYAMGCLSERYREDVTTEMPALDGVYGKFDWIKLVDALVEQHKEIEKPWARTLSTAPHHAYIKISEGCNRFCAFCAIPLITGRHHSRPVNEIVNEVKDLVAQGVKEFNIIAQDLSSYGRDLPGRKGRLDELLENLAAIEGVEMIRLHYAYPSDFPYEILPVMARHSNICKYLDIALQHIDDGVLSNMRRHINAEDTRRLLERIRREVPGIFIRTTMMVGFPGETDEAFSRLLDFVKEQRFERLGAFAYCEEEGTYGAEHLKDDIDEEVKQSRLDELMAVQQRIAREIAEGFIGTVQKVIVDEKSEDGHYIGRTQYDSPEVDPCVFISSDEDLQIGEIYNVEITGAEEFDLWGRIAKQ